MKEFLLSQQNRPPIPGDAAVSFGMPSWSFIFSSLSLTTQSIIRLKTDSILVIDESFLAFTTFGAFVLT
jgi:hypothetical protein